MEALALTDRDGVYGAVEFYRACRENGIRPILGVEITGGPGRAVFLARNRRGWEEVCTITTARRLRRDFSLSRALRGIGGDITAFTDYPELLPETFHPPRNLYLEINTFMPSSRRREITRQAKLRGIPLLASNDCCLLRPEDRPLAGILAAIREDIQIKTS
jgi:DNA polymerase III alpha subunit